jgi:predicted DNA-binding transcriptional regulator AlpA
MEDRMSAAGTPKGPTLEEIRRWPATVSVEDAAAALGISRAHAYDLIKAQSFPANALPVGRRIRVTTRSILAVIDDDAASSRQGQAA